jgi:hypothetical protein
MGLAYALGLPPCCGARPPREVSRSGVVAVRLTNEMAAAATSF